MKKSAITLVCALLICGNLFAQGTDKPKTMRGGGGGFNVGYGNFNVSKLQEFLPSDFKSLNNDHLLLGGHGYSFLGNLVIGGSGMGVIGNSINSSGLKVNVNGGFGTFDIGYLVINKEALKVYPVVGFGGGGFGINVARNEDVSVSEVKNSPGREINISKGGFIFNFSANLSFVPVLKYDEEENTYGGFMAGIKAGYLYQLPSSNWSYSGGDVTDGPDFGLNGPYITLVIGGFGYRSK